MGTINRDNARVAIKDDNVEVRLSEAGDMTVSFIRFRKGTDLEPALAGLPDDLCPCPHWGYMLKGRQDEDPQRRRSVRGGASVLLASWPRPQRPRGLRVRGLLANAAVRCGHRPPHRLS